MRDLAVVGLGLIGSAALRHGARSASVVGIGPAEPEDWPSHDGPFASHYDSGRITRRIDAKRQWAVLATRAIANYPELEQRSGIEFHRQTGIAFVRNDRAGLDRLTGVAAELGIPIATGSVEDQLQDLPMLSLPTHFSVVREAGPAGAVDPRGMVAAQLQVAEQDGAEVIRDVVQSITPTGSGFELTTTGGVTCQAREVIVAAGAYSGALAGEPLQIAVRPEAVVLGEVTREQADELAALPSVLYLLEHPMLDDVYIVPPMRYPDGRWFVKIGGSRRDAPLFATAAEMNRSMRPGTDDEQLEVLRDVLISVLPDVSFGDWQSKPCLIADTASGLPYVDRLGSGVTLACGGNGHAAKSSDALGALAASLALEGRWTDRELQPQDFAVQLGQHVPRPGSRHGN